MGVPCKQLHSYDYGGPYAGFRGAINFYREIDRMVNTQNLVDDPRPLGNGRRHAGSHRTSSLTKRRRAMLLRHTTAEVVERKALTVNPAKTCQPIGAMYAALGIHRCLPHSHGSQGCCAYHRSALTRHYKEPVMAATSSFTEGSSVFGGQANLLQAIQNIFTHLQPRRDRRAHHLPVRDHRRRHPADHRQGPRREARFPPGKFVIHANTPSYVGSHVTGFSNMVRAMVDYFAEQAEPKRPRRSTSSPAGSSRPTCARSSGLAGVLGVPDDHLPRHLRRARRPADRQARVLSRRAA